MRHINGSEEAKVQSLSGAIGQAKEDVAHHRKLAGRNLRRLAYVATTLIVVGFAVMTLTENFAINVARELGNVVSKVPPAAASNSSKVSTREISNQFGYFMLSGLVLLELMFMGLLRHHIKRAAIFENSGAAIKWKFVRIFPTSAIGVKR